LLDDCTLGVDKGEELVGERPEKLLGLGGGCRDDEVDTRRGTGEVAQNTRSGVELSLVNGSITIDAR
jgi:hypothetical protein